MGFSKPLQGVQFKSQNHVRIILWLWILRETLFPYRISDWVQQAFLVLPLCQWVNYFLVKLFTKDIVLWGSWPYFCTIGRSRTLVVCSHVTVKICKTVKTSWSLRLAVVPKLNVNSPLWFSALTSNLASGNFCYLHPNSCIHLEGFLPHLEGFLHVLCQGFLSRCLVH